MAKAKAIEDGDDYVGIMLATRLTGRSIEWIRRRVVLGQIGTRALKGMPCLYRRADLERAAAECPMGTTSPPPRPRASA
jgi:hypothetical protein